MSMRYVDVQEGEIYYMKQHQVRVVAKTAHVDEFNNETPALEIIYLNQPAHMSPTLTGSGNISEDPLHCHECQTLLIDTIQLGECQRCRRIICLSCNSCHCGTTWDPNK
ncbi:hypothetical protein CN505_20895 [Bacillus cereus]|nr:hypothetical protein CON53_30715 [Bacillus cereus]PES85676.1 hypothetical protein CN509_00420 [Bacillus cereus]PET02788.1 hypothetical protein CN505_20895 [Bacillus cereus]PFH77653.1 hypothetical protein COI81_31245 [Bacillus cereus]PFM54451.1 hypothetical protein COJ52_21475 [Bacillus cereus]